MHNPALWCAADEEACSRQHLEGGSEYGIAHPIMRPRDFCTQRQKGARAERNGAPIARLLDELVSSYKEGLGHG